MSLAEETVSEVIEEEHVIVILLPDSVEQNGESDREGIDIFLDDYRMPAEIAGHMEAHTSELGGLEEETSKNLQDHRWKKNQKKILADPDELEYYFEISDYQDKSMD